MLTTSLLVTSLLTPLSHRREEAEEKARLGATPVTHVFLPLPSKLPDTSHIAFSYLSVLCEVGRLEGELETVKNDYLAGKKDAADAERKVRDKRKFRDRMKVRVADDVVRRAVEEAVGRYNVEGKLKEGRGMEEIPVEEVKVEKAAVAVTEKEREDDDGGMGFGDMLSVLEGEGAGGKEKETPDANAFKVVKSTKKVGSYLTPPQWTGATPWSYLKMIHKKATWKHGEKGGIGSIRTDATSVEITEEGMGREMEGSRVVTKGDFKDFVSLKFLYETAPSLNPAPLFPAAWVEIWKKWKFAEGSTHREATERIQEQWGWVRGQMWQVKGRIRFATVEEAEEWNGRREIARKGRTSNFKPMSWHWNTDSYKEMRRGREKLPAWRWREKVVEVAHNSRVTMIKGTTGCGKSTQVPHFLLAAGKDTKIVVTQPRR